MKIRHVYKKGLFKHPEEEKVSAHRQFLTDSFFRQLSTREDFIHNNSIFVIINVHVTKPTAQHNRVKIKTIFEWFRQDSCINHIIQYIHEHFDFDTSKYILKNESDNKIYRDLNEVLPAKDRLIFSFQPGE